MSDWSKFNDIKTGGGDILKPEPGKSYKIRIIGEPYLYSSDFNGNLSVRIALTIYNQTQDVAQILMLSKAAFSDIFDLKEDGEWGDPEAYDITMKRTGEGLETKYSFIPSAKKPIETEKKAAVETIVLRDVLDRLPSVQQSFPISEVDPEELMKKKPGKAVTPSDSSSDAPNLDENGIPY